ncbi:MAG: hypothetical protein II187_04385 [Treponema sp.]|nr:hypothetical protein [Treponema sp.]
MKKTASAVAVLVTLLAAASAIEVNQPELESKGADSIQFENYSGPHAVIETAAAITNIGTVLGAQVAQAPEEPAVIQPNGKYTLIHAVDPDTPEKLDADILVLNANAGVDHIKNLRRIIIGYLTAAYGYDTTDADTLATFITVYNAVYRGQFSVFTEKYKETVIQNLTEEKAGLSTNWEEWPGRTQIVVPLSVLRDGLSAVDTTTISDEQVIDALKQDEGKNIEARENMASIKERESTDATVKAQEAQKEAAQQKAAAAAAETPEEAEAAAAKAEEAAQVATEQQQQADKKRVEAKAEREDIAKDKEEKVPVVDTSNYLTGLFVSDEANGLYKFITVDGVEGTTVLSSPVTQIRNRNVYPVTDITITGEDGEQTLYPTMYLAVCGLDNSHSAIKLCLIDATRLEIQKESTEMLAEGTDLLRQGDSFYAIIRDSDGSCYLGQYDKNLTLLHKSSSAVKTSSPLNMTTKGILVTDSSGAPRMLSTDDLSTIW